ncbi:hypothetical protein RJT34_15466 [Clitoria ternatea]|uniref:DEAD-box ATP-dependent RNA helicase 10 n=1 Tax=Clitoria ternatea TaxID=43366 RepID=A0AAN9J5H4_CLITE
MGILYWPIISCDEAVETAGISTPGRFPLCSSFQPRIESDVFPTISSALLIDGIPPSQWNKKFLEFKAWMDAKIVQHEESYKSLSHSLRLGPSSLSLIICATATPKQSTASAPRFSLSQATVSPHRRLTHSLVSGLAVSPSHDPSLPRFTLRKVISVSRLTFISLQASPPNGKSPCSCCTRARPGDISTCDLLETDMGEEIEEKKTFKDLGLSEPLVEACEKLGWKNPLKIQAEAIPLALEGKDVIGLAQTGSGKTGAFALPILHTLLDAPRPKDFFACVLSPTRELAIQIAEQFEALGSEIGVKCAVLVGGIDMVQQSIKIAKQPHIIVGTPGRVLDHLKNTKGFSLSKLKYLVLDEADRLLNEDFEESLNEILQMIPSERRTFLFSATMTKKVQKLQRVCLRNPVKIEAASKYSTVDTLKQQYRFLPAKHKDCYLVYILTEMVGSTSMVFTRTCDSTQLLALILRNLGLKAIPINGHMSQPKRLGALNKFKSGDCNILLCTDVASRGLDIPTVDMVINYDIPTNSKDYIHRVGRTARAGRSGVAISLVNQYELEWYIQIEKLIGKKLPEYPAQEEEVLLLEERVGEAKRLAVMKMKEAGGNKKRRGGGDFEEEDIDKYLGLKNGKSSKKFRRK